MGLLIHTEFETPEGLPVSSVYCRITGLVCDVVSRTEMRVVVKLETFLSRDKRVAGARKLKTPTVPEYSVLTVPLNGEWGSLAYLYGQLKPVLSVGEVTVEDVLESDG